MHKVYLRQAWQMIRQNGFISAIAIAGTAMAIMMIMVLILADQVQNVNMAPEIHRDRTLYVREHMQYDTTGGNDRSRGGDIHYSLAKEYLLGLKTPELTATVNKYLENAFWLINRQGSAETVDALLRTTDANYWQLMSFSFLAGRPFSQEEYHSGVQVAVLSESMAAKLFPGEEAVGQTVDIKFVPFRVIGVVRDVPPVFREATGDVWVPVTAQQEYGNTGMIIMMLMRDKADREAIFREVLESERRFHLANAPWTLYLAGPENRRVYTMGIRDLFNHESEGPVIRTQYRKRALILLVLLLIPAVNLTGFSLSRMKKRMAEIGVRKAFGAKRHTILTQVLYENMLTSLIGGLLGLLLSYPVLYSLRHWLLGIPAGSELPAATMLSLPIFLATLLVCLLLNLLSAGLPAYRASRISIVDSLYQNDKRV